MKLRNIILPAIAIAVCTSCGNRHGQDIPADVPVIAVGIMSAPEVELIVRDSTEVVCDTARFTPAELDGQIRITAPAGGTIEVADVTIGVGFHWQQSENQRFEGNIRLLPQGDSIVVINDIDIERYLESVISSEMSAQSPAELLRAHAIISRSWLLSQLANKNHRPETRSETDSEVTVWYDRDDHELFDVCADDHCQRYQGITRMTSPAVADAVRATRGEVLTSDGELCDARFSKCCGGVTEEFENCWEPDHKNYLEARCDSPTPLPVPDLTDEVAAAKWIEGRPDAFCAAPGSEILAAVLNSYDRATTDFYRWTITYRADSLGQLFAGRTGYNLGYIVALKPLARGTSGRITRLKVTGHEDSIIIGKELEIRRSLSPSHLYSSAFTVDIDGEGPEATVTLRGAGWGHGVGLCQIGAAVMAVNGYRHQDILSHYFPNTTISTIYK